MMSREPSGSKSPSSVHRQNALMAVRRKFRNDPRWMFFLYSVHRWRGTDYPHLVGLLSREDAEDSLAYDAEHRHPSYQALLIISEDGEAFVVREYVAGRETIGPGSSLVSASGCWEDSDAAACFDPRAVAIDYIANEGAARFPGAAALAIVVADRHPWIVALPYASRQEAEDATGTLLPFVQRAGAYLAVFDAEIGVNSPAYEIR